MWARAVVPLHLNNEATSFESERHNVLASRGGYYNDPYAYAVKYEQDVSSEDDEPLSMAFKGRRQPHFRNEAAFMPVFRGVKAHGHSMGYPIPTFPPEGHQFVETAFVAEATPQRSPPKPKKAKSSKAKAMADSTYSPVKTKPKKKSSKKEPPSVKKKRIRHSPSVSPMKTAKSVESTKAVSKKRKRSVEATYSSSEELLHEFSPQISKKKKESKSLSSKSQSKGKKKSKSSSSKVEEERRDATCFICSLPKGDMRTLPCSKCSRVYHTKCYRLRWGFVSVGQATWQCWLCSHGLKKDGKLVKALVRMKPLGGNNGSDTGHDNLAATEDEEPVMTPLDTWLFSQLDQAGEPTNENSSVRKTDLRRRAVQQKRRIRLRKLMMFKRQATQPVQSRLKKAKACVDNRTAQMNKWIERISKVTDTAMKTFEKEELVSCLKAKAVISSVAEGVQSLSRMLKELNSDVRTLCESQKEPDIKLFEMKVAEQRQLKTGTVWSSKVSRSPPRSSAAVKRQRAPKHKKETQVISKESEGLLAEYIGMEESAEKIEGSETKPSEGEPAKGNQEDYKEGRPIYSGPQLRELESLFAVNPTPTAEELQDLQKILAKLSKTKIASQLSSPQLNLWFHKRKFQADNNKALPRPIIEVLEESFRANESPNNEELQELALLIASKHKSSMGKNSIETWFENRHILQQVETEEDAIYSHSAANEESSALEVFSPEQVAKLEEWYVKLGQEHLQEQVKLSDITRDINEILPATAKNGRTAIDAKSVETWYNDRKTKTGLTKSFTPAQIVLLEQWFADQPTPTTEAYKEMAETLSGPSMVDRVLQPLGLSWLQVRRWFEHRRHTLNPSSKRQQLDKELEGLISRLSGTKGKEDLEKLNTTVRHSAEEDQQSSGSSLESDEEATASAVSDSLSLLSAVALGLDKSRPTSRRKEQAHPEGEPMTTDGNDGKDSFPGMSKTRKQLKSMSKNAQGWQMHESSAKTSDNADLEAALEAREDEYKSKEDKTSAQCSEALGANDEEDFRSSQSSLSRRRSTRLAGKN